jgi:Flp pilus assembly protein TadD
VAALVAGCATQLPDGLAPATISTAELLRAAPVTGPADAAPLADAAVLLLDDEMRRFVKANVSRNLPQDRRLTRLINAVMGKDSLGIDYNDRTYTAAEAFRLREANCLSFTNMFVALARSVDLPVSYQEVDVPPDWTREGDTLVLNRHINAIVTTREGREHIVDFNIADFRASYDRRKVSDARAFAHYYSNLAAERLQAGDALEALRHLRKAIDQDGGFTAAWVNLGTLYLRAGYPDLARAAWRHALEIDAGELVAMSNLERLYRDAGDTRTADELAGRIERHRMQNPYYRYHLARQAFERQDYDTAIDHMKFATRVKQNEDTFYALLGMSYLRRGDPESARRWITRAEEVAVGDERTTYHGKLEMLKRMGAG